MAKTTKKTAYSRLVSKKSDYCKGKTTATEVKKLAATYIKNTVAKKTKGLKGSDRATATKKAKAEATSKANRVLRGGCKITSVIAGKSKKAKPISPFKSVTGVAATKKRTAAKRKKTTKRKTTKRRY